MNSLAWITLERVFELMSIGVAGYFVLLGLLFSCGLGMPLPEDIPLLVAGALVGAGKMKLLWVAIAAWCGIIGGDCVLYSMGRRYGLNITKAPVIGKHVTRERIMQAERLFERYGVWVVGVGRMFAGIRGAMVIAAGTIRFGFIKFLIADGLAALVSGGLFVWLGTKFGENLPYISKEIHKYGEWIAGGVITLALLVFVYYWWRKGGHPKPSEMVADKVEQVAEHGLHLPGHKPAPQTVEASTTSPSVEESKLK